MNQSILDLIEAEADIRSSYAFLRCQDIFHPGTVKQSEYEAVEANMFAVQAEIDRLNSFIKEGI